MSEPGKTGSQWRVHYSLRWPSLECDYFKLTPVEGPGQGESLYQFTFAPGDFVLADRGYCHAQAIGQAIRQGAFLAVRLNPQGISLQTPGGDPYPLVNKLQSLKGAGQTAEWEVQYPSARQGTAAASPAVRGAQECGGHSAGAEKTPAQSPQRRVAIAARKLDLRAIRDGPEHFSQSHL